MTFPLDDAAAFALYGPKPPPAKTVAKPAPVPISPEIVPGYSVPATAAIPSIAAQVPHVAPVSSPAAPPPLAAAPKLLDSLKAKFGGGQPARVADAQMAGLDLAFSNATSGMFEDQELRIDQFTGQPYHVAIDDLHPLVRPELAPSVEQIMRSSTEVVPGFTHQPARAPQPPPPPPAPPRPITYPRTSITPDIGAGSPLAMELAASGKFEPPPIAAYGGQLGLPGPVRKTLVDQLLAGLPIQENEKERIRKSTKWVSTGLNLDEASWTRGGHYDQGDIFVGQPVAQDDTLLHEAAHKMLDIHTQRDPVFARQFMEAVENAVRSGTVPAFVIEAAHDGQRHGNNVLAGAGLPGPLLKVAQALPFSESKFSGPIHETYAILIESVKGDLSLLPPELRRFYEDWITPPTVDPSMHGPSLTQLWYGR